MTDQPPARLTGVGVGPGDPGLLTITGRDTLRAADVVFVPVAEVDTLGYAERVVRAHVPHGTPLRRLVFRLDPEVRAETWRRAGEAVAGELRAGRQVAFATIGDPNVYSTFAYLARVVRVRVAGVEVTTVPGITAMQDLAARSSTVLVEHDERLALLPLTAGPEAVRTALDVFDTVVCYKGGRHLADVRRLVADAGRSEHLVYGARLGLDDEDIRRGRGLPEGPGPYLSTVIVTPPREEPT